MTSETGFLPSVLITGCSVGGIGPALAEEFHCRGLHVFATARSREKMAPLEKLSNATLLELDVTSPQSIAAAVEAVTAKTGGKLDYLVNNSGQNIVRPILDTSVEEAKRLFDVNFWGAASMVQAFAPLVIAAKGMIVNLASVSAWYHGPWLSYYAASKAALVAYSDVLTLELKPFGVRVITVVAGTVQTNIFSNYAGRPDSTLPPNSLYMGAAQDVQDWTDGKVVKDAMSPDDFAKRVVGDVLGGGSGTIWRGTGATVSRIVFSIFPSSLLMRFSFWYAGLGNV
ncbi:hypothetical protein BDV25DRAFT_168443 [Aspergillus avenaceus]|uniref:Oxidoreductase n=1 Tax=Aspergillus avenaceus TaxID=36643 RepID=A0A5N6U551_ASPAV|nr:hypothetical protein BDV25DRAFT_168443 [Aspergillus avenaceus]